MTAVYIGNLSWSVTEADLTDLMQQAGEVISSQVIKYADGRSKGWGLVQFVDQAGAANAIAQLNEYELLGRKILIREDRGHSSVGGGLPPPGGGGLTAGFGAMDLSGGGGKGGGKGGGRSGRGRGSRARPPLEPPLVEPTSGSSLYVGNLPWSTTSDVLKGVFAEYNVKTADVKHGYDGRSRGYGVVGFESEDDAAAALALSGYVMDGRSMEVRYDRGARSDE